MSHTIAAISTPPYESAVGILRISGPDSFSIVRALFFPTGGKKLEDYPLRTMMYGRIKNSAGETLDRGMCALFKAPASYTGEDMAELYCHGSPVVLAALASSAYRLGARPAEPGEFTKRAFLSGKLDLSQAEAVADLISARSERAAILSAGQLGGGLSRRIDEIYSALSHLCAHFQAVADYPDEDIEPFEIPALAAQIDAQSKRTEELLRAYNRGRYIKDGLPCAIIGRPNAGKSSLLNALLGFSRAIVTDIPGTTRDTLEETITLNGRLFRLTDTAGLRDSSDPVERMGVERARKAAEDAALILVVIDLSLPFSEEEGRVLEAVNKLTAGSEEKRCLFVFNKSDLPAVREMPDLPEGSRWVRVSALTGEGLPELIDGILALTGDRETEPGKAYLENARHLNSITRAHESLIRASRALSDRLTPDAVLLDIEEAMGALSEITGRTVNEDIVNTIFSRFCVGK